MLGAVFGIGLAVVMARFKVVERGLLPYVIASQTVPLIALAPQVAALAGNWDLPKWTWVSALGAFLAFFPITVATLKGLSIGAGGLARADGQLRRGLEDDAGEAAVPGGVPTIVPGLKLAATASVIGVIVSEISTGVAAASARRR